MTHDDMNRERPYRGILAGGFTALAGVLALGALGILGIISGNWALAVPGTLAVVAALVALGGFVQLEPNQAVVTVFFGRYCGTFDRTGLWWINPLMKHRRVSLRINNLDVNPIKVNDLVGNPILIGLVLVWRIRDTYRVTFDLDSEGGQTTVGFVAIQSDAALREVAGRYPYDGCEESAHDGPESALTLRSGGTEINAELERKLNERLALAGIEVVEARINYLAYAPEIAAVMLRRQQASAIIAAREKIVEGAVSMVRMAVDGVEKEGTVSLDNAQRAALVGNLLVVLCADDSPTPVVNTGA